MCKKEKLIGLIGDGYCKNKPLTELKWNNNGNRDRQEPCKTAFNIWCRDQGDCLKVSIREGEKVAPLSSTEAPYCLGLNKSNGEEMTFGFDSTYVE